MSIIPEILKNPNNALFNLEEAEVYSLKEAKELIELEKYSYSLFALWNSVVINLQRRIEKFGIDNFTNVLNQSETYNKNAHNLKDRWLNINEFNLIDYALKLTIINHATHDLITTLYWMKSNTNEEENRRVDKDEIYSLLFLIEKNLFSKEFKLDKRTSNDTSKNEYKRRKNDKDEVSSNLSNTHQELLLRSSTNIFNKTSEKSEYSSLLNRYI